MHPLNLIVLCTKRSSAFAPDLTILSVRLSYLCSACTLPGLQVTFPGLQATSILF